MAYQPRYPDLYEQWITHDLAKFRYPFYANLREADQLRVWEYIESNYLSKYQRLIRIEFEWSAEGMWGIPFPGSVDMGKYLYPADFGLPQAVHAELRAWHREHDLGAKPWEPVDTFDYEASAAKGLAVAKKIKAFLGESYYIEFNPFKELRCAGHDVVEAEVPAFILSMAGTVKT